MSKFKDGVRGGFLNSGLKRVVEAETLCNFSIFSNFPKTRHDIFHDCLFVITLVLVLLLTLF